MTQLLLNTVSLGAAYSLLAIGFVLVLNATGAVNLAHGSFVVVGGFIAASCGAMLKLPGAIVLPAVLAGMMLIGGLLSLIAYYPLRNRPAVSVFISTISMSAILETAALLVFGPSPRVGPPILSAGSIQLGSAILNVQSLSTIVLAITLVLAQYLILSRTVLGKRLRAVAEDREMATALGMNVNLMILITFGIAAALAGAAGLIFANTFYITPGDGEAYMIKTYVAATMGGWGSLRGAVVGAFLVAAFEVLVPSLPIILPSLVGALPSAGALFSPTASTIWLYLAFLIVLFFRPQGLFGEAVQQRA
ncbi:branched-chain amino acid ABC transporter permease [Bradyrhizobium sp. Arg237L]|uniref:branched-chain amino acid ABC transporter permease n=1 Tax=Bradyrhizobium sp. Arg237L TaxID=3003352 RepID=UPI00249E617B|nr:branched-chain amino acid ABC transporter permease [Bradyrhizobium sp. Arg237L]MDI4237133.1 branched-chain amino acid ABC transporter permease [Bradyrhizobium sp. Arg237L]